MLKSTGTNCTLIGREDLHRGILEDKDLVIAVGGDGTVLNTASFLDDHIPILGVNSDPSRPEELGVTQVKDERRSKGALCGTDANNFQSVIPNIVHGEHLPGIRTRIRCVVRSTYLETRLPPALNDILIAHPIPAAVSRFRITMKQDTIAYQSQSQSHHASTSDLNGDVSVASFNYCSFIKYTTVLHNR